MELIKLTTEQYIEMVKRGEFPFTGFDAQGEYDASDVDFARVAAETGMKILLYSGAELNEEHWLNQCKDETGSIEERG